MKSFYKLFLLLTLFSASINQLSAEVTAAFIKFQNPSCFGAQDGYVTIDSLQTTAPTGPYSISVNTSPSATFFNVGDTVFGLGSGSYSITIRDLGDGNKLLFPRPSFVINEPFQISTLITSTPISCFDTCDGTAEVLIGNGTPPYTVQWSDPLMQDSTTAIDLCDGEYFVTVTDTNGCSVIDSITITEPNEILPNVAITDVSCFGFSDGSATSVPSGGTGTYTNYEWSSNAANNTDTETGLSVGTYTITVTDDSGCIGIETFTVDGPAAALSVSLSKIDVFCFGDSTGVINTARSGGTPPYTYTWSDGPDTTRNRTGLAANTYTVTVEDQNACSETASITVTEQPAFNVTFSQVDVDCFGDSTGSITASISGATPAYSFEWSESTSGTGNSSTISNLAAGTYTITVTDALLCEYIDSVTIIEASAISISVNTLTEPLCNGSSDGSIDIDVSGGTPAYTFAWSNSDITEDISGIPAGTYQVVVTDNNGCADSLSIILGAPSLLTATIDSVLDASCNGNNDGFARVLANGGTGAYTYLWSNSPTTAANPNLIANTYTVTVSDANSCTATTTAIVGQPAVLVASITSTDASCAGIDDGSATASGSGGTSPYSFLWSTAGADTTATINGLTGGTYTVTVSDSQGCDDVTSVLINQPSAISTSTTAIDADCNGDSTGSATVSASGGTPAYTFLWDSNALDQTTATATNLSSGTYFVTVSDNNGCSTVDSATVNEPTAVVASISASTNPSCNGDSDGSATVSATGGTGAYTFQWDANAGGQMTATATGLGDGTYLVTVSDANGCTDTSTVNLSEPAALTVSADSLVDISCNGANDGFIRVAGNGGTPPYTFNWGGPTGNTRSNLTPGSYTVTISDANNCDSVASFVISEPDSVTTNLTTINESCAGNDGEVDASGATGGTAPYTYAWSGTTNTSSTIDTLTAGSYTLTITDANNCQKIESFTIGSDPGIDDRETVVDVTCGGGSDGSITLSPSGGTAPYTYAWDDGPTTFFRFALSEGTYTVTITDNATPSCSVVETYIVGGPDTLNPTISAVDAGCVALGSASVSTVGGSGPYTFNWGPGNPIGQGTDSISGLVAGTYSLTVTDSLGCDSIQSFTINAASANFTFRRSVINDSCFAQCNGFAGVSFLSGGTAPYTFEWDDLSTNSFRDNLCAGSYTLEISDANGCDSIVSFTITEPDSISTNLVITDETCAGNDGIADASAPTGGTPPYTFNWGPGNPIGQGTSIISSLSAQTYTLTITDNNNCEKIESFVINSSTGIDDGETVVDVLCAGDSTGSVTLSPSGGNAPYSFSWNTGSNQFFINNLQAGNYSVTITDNSTPACTTLASYVIDEPDTLKPTLTFTGSGCSTAGTGTATVATSGGVPPYTFNWGPGNPIGQGTATVSSLGAGAYTVTVSDANGCDSVQTFNISSGVSNFVFTDSVRPTTCFGTCDGFAGVLGLSGGNPPYTFNWNVAGSINSTRNDLCAGSYSLTISDSFGCDSIVSFTVIDADSIEATVTSIPDTCVAKVGSASIVVNSGGTGPYTFNWPPDGPSSGNSIDSLFPGNYQLTITDATGCSIEKGFSIGNIAPFNIDITKKDISCKDADDGEIDVSAAGGTNPLTYEWVAGTSFLVGANPRNVTAGTYTITITDANGCAAVNSVTVNEPDSLLASFLVVNDSSCTAAREGIATALATGGTPPYTYNWSAGIPLNNTTSDLASGSYFLTLRDANGCVFSESFTIGSVAPFGIVVDTTPASCGGVMDGSITITTLGSTPPLTYDWQSGSGLMGANPTGVAGGTYALTVTDGSGCSQTESVVVREENDIILDTTIIMDESCTPGSDGYAKIVISGGLQPYTYVWSPSTVDGQGTDSIFNLSPFGGSQAYEVVVTDANGCTKRFNAVVETGENIDANENIVFPTCFGNCDGSIRLSPTGGVRPYSYAWSDTTLTDSSRSDLCVGVYQVTITDNATPPCTKVEVIVVENRPILTVVEIKSFVESCVPGSDGSAAITAGGGTPPYTYDWSSGNKDSNTGVFDLEAGIHTVTVTDANGCTATESFQTFKAPDPIVTTTSTNPTCNGGSDGTITVNTSLGLNPLTYNWTGGPPIPVGADPQNLPAGTYTISVTDKLGCVGSSTATLIDEAPITASFAITDESCTPGFDGGAVATPTGGTPPYTYTWPASGTATGNTVTGLEANTYNVTITDDSSCTVIIPFTIGSTAPFNVTITKDSVTCRGGNDGEITVTTSAASPTFTWATLPAGSSQTGLEAGTYFLTVTDGVTGCNETETIIVEEPDTFLSNAILTNVSCSGNGSDGEIDLNVTGGTSPYTYNWGGGITTEDRINLGVNTYTVTVTDDNGCQFSESFTIIDEPTITLDLDSVDVTCNGFSDGRITLTTSSLNPTFNWSPSVPSPNQGNQNGVAANTYKVTVTDAVTGCSAIDSITVNQPAALSATISTSPASCSPGSDGSAIANVLGGDAPYTYNWPAGIPIGNTVTGLAANSYNLTVVDNSNCSSIFPFTIGSSAAFSINFTNRIEPNCFGDSTGQFSTNVVGAGGPLGFAWSSALPPQANQVGLAAGTYTVTVTDSANGCTETANITLGQPSDILATATIIRESCSPGADGEIDISVSGGTVAGAYTYNWSANTAPNQALEDQTGLLADTYEVTITDDNGCISLDTFIVGNSAPFDVTVVKTDLDCFGDMDGTIDVTVSGSISGTISYTWDPPQGNTPNLTGLEARDYDLTITDAGNGCIDTRTITINAPSEIMVTASTTPESCSPGDDGTITLDAVTGGTSTGGVYLYNWTGAGITNPSNRNQTALASGSYTVTITDDNACTIVETFNVGVSAPFDVNLDSTDVSCNGLSDGSVLVSTTASNPTYAWTPSNLSGNNPTGLLAGTYTVTVTEPSSGCAESATITVNEPANISASFTVTNSTCGNSDGRIVASLISGGTAPRTITWLDASKLPIGQSGNTADTLAAGTYFAAFSDANNCPDTLSAQVSDDAGPTATIASVDASCGNSCDGTATVTSTCLSTTCVIEWRDNSGTVIGSTASISNLCPGDYFAEITDIATNCVTNLSITINQGSSILANLTTVDNACSALTVCSGEAAVNPSGGTAPYTYNWSGPSSPIIGQGTDSIFSLCPGNYDVTVTDANGCDTSLSFVINARAIISPNFTSSNETCTGANDGTISLAPLGGTSPYTYNWSPVPGNGQGVANATGLSAQNYDVTITDALGCDTSITVNVGSGAFVYSIAKTDLSCNGTPDGTADVTIVGGSLGFSFNWDPAPGAGQGTANVTGLSDLKYQVTITAGSGCSAIDSVTINSSSPISPNESFTDETCAGLCNGTIDLNASGGAGAPYTYNWSPVPPNGQGVANATALCTGDYFITVSDASGCDTVISITIQGSTALVSSITTEDMSCNNSDPCDGSASISVSGGSAPYTYNWSAGNVVGAAGDTVNTLCVGEYTVTISDANGCSRIDTFNISAPPTIAASFNSVNSTCNFADGSITVSPSGGTPGYAFEWFDVGLNALNITTPTISNIASGIYFVDVTDVIGCVEQFSTALSDDGGEVVTTSQTNVTCFGGSDGTAKASFNCADPACSVQWFDGATGLSLNVTIDSVSNLKAGSYFVQVTNNSGCNTFENVIITQPDPFEVIPNIVDETCNGGCNGSISVVATGGTGNISYNWGPGPLVGQGTNSISNLCSGIYSLTVTDDNGCDSVFTFNVGQPAAFTTSFTYSESNCSLADGSITATVNGGTVAVDYQYQWLDGTNKVLVGETNATINNISAGAYFLRVRDDNLCQERFTAVLGDQNGPTVVVDSTIDAGCFGENDGAIYITASGSNTPYTFNWLPNGQTTEDIINLRAGSYTVEVSDALGCIGTDTATIVSSDELIATITTDDATCGVCNGEADISVVGGTAPYTYLWSNGSVADTAGSLCGGAHSVIITDANGCSITESFSVNTDGGPTGETITAMATSCATSCDGSVTVTPVGGTAPYTYLWQHNGATTNSLTGLCKGTYFIQISDVSGCSRNVRVEIDSPNEITINDQVRGSECSAICDGSISLNVFGGTRPYTYSWGPTPRPNNSFIGNLCAGIYQVTVSDANGCSETKTINVSNNGNAIVANPTATDANCFGTCDGSLISNVTTSPSVEFRWFDNQGVAIAATNTNLINAACAGEYILETTTLPQGCKSYTTVVVEEPDSITLAPSIVKNISCAGSCDGEIFVSTQGGSLLFNYSWSDAQTDVPATGLCAGTYTVTATDANGCTAVNSVSLVNPPILTLNISGVTGVNCSSDCDGTATATANGGVPPYDFSWDGGQTGFNPIDLCFGQNILTLTDATGCMLMDTVNISATDTVIAETPNDALSCGNDSIYLDGTVVGSTVNSIRWVEGDTTTLITTRTDTAISRPVGNYTFYFIVSNGNCSDTASYTVEVVESPMLGVTSPIAIFKDEVANFEVTNQDPTYLYNWSPATDLTDSTIAEPISSTRETRLYILTVTDTNNCTYLDSVEVIYSRDINIPSGFSPNGDGKNDVWRIDILSEFPGATVQVYNRWGELLYEQTNGYTVPWDGTYEGKALPIGTYYYVVNFKSNRFDPATGPVTIVK